MDTYVQSNITQRFWARIVGVVMKDLVKKFIVLQIQTAPSRLQPASARCFLAAMILPCATSGNRAHVQHATLSLPAGLAFQNIGVPSRPQRKICDYNHKAHT